MIVMAGFFVSFALELQGHKEIDSCALHNARVGGAPLSQHLRLAADISLRGHNRFDLRAACQQAGFTGFGYYTTFLHVDLGRSRHWYGNQNARKLWML